MLSHKSKYALKAMLALSNQYGKGPLLIPDIAAREKIPRRFLEVILVELRNQGVVLSKKGKRGGYTLSRSPSEISVGHVLRMIDGTLAPLSCVSKTAYEQCNDCPDEKTCAVRILMKKVRDVTAAIFDSTTFGHLVRISHKSAANNHGLYFPI
jgi:Rrf2 family protein